MIQEILYRLQILTVHDFETTLVFSLVLNTCLAKLIKTVTNVRLLFQKVNIQLVFAGDLYKNPLTLFQIPE